ncbi:hypothetical protein F4806DRAFT_501617 [Annulohypoxylon nitens]|nr:hypothetical protein F4806DRAFT_501617 [Annulohypoxylon nitens]
MPSRRSGYSLPTKRRRTTNQADTNPYVSGYVSDDVSYPDSENEDDKTRGGQDKAKLTTKSKRAALLEAFRNLDPELQTVGKDQMWRISEMAKGARVRIAAHRSSLDSIESILATIPSSANAVGPRWTHEEEEELQNQLRQDPYLNYLQSSPDPPNVHTRSLTMWMKVCRPRSYLPMTYSPPPITWTLPWVACRVAIGSSFPPSSGTRQPAASTTAAEFSFSPEASPTAASWSAWTLYPAMGAKQARIREHLAKMNLTLEYARAVFGHVFEDNPGNSTPSHPSLGEEGS